MLQQKFTNLQQYLRWLMTQYQAMQKIQQDAYRIVDKQIDSRGNCKLVIQVIGKSITFKAAPEDLAADDQMLERFSRKDVRTITYYACQEIKKPQARIIFKEFCEKLNRIIFGIKQRNQESIIQKSAGEISLDKNLLNNLTQEEAHLVGYTTATEQLLEEKENLKKLTETQE